MGIAPVAHNPAVGENLQDHYNVALQYRLKPGTHSLNDFAGRSRWTAGLRYILTRTGPLSDAAAHAIAFARTRTDLSDPNIKFVILPLTMALTNLGNGKQAFVLGEEPGLTLAPCQLRRNRVAPCTLQ